MFMFKLKNFTFIVFKIRELVISGKFIFINMFNFKINYVNSKFVFYILESSNI